MCVGAIIAFAVGAFASAWWGVDTVSALQIVAGVFGGELLLTAVLRVTEDKKTKRETEGKKDA